jgi:glycosyltransferase involved in cell wall biosynthesis
MPDRLTVAMVVGTPLGDGQDNLHCGVRDYSICLARALSDSGVSVQITAPASWGVRDGLTWMRTLRQMRPDVVHLQYPSIGHRHSLLPHMLGPMGLGRHFVVSLHEHSALPRVQRMANMLFRATAERLVFTTSYEACKFGTTAGPVIPIGSNVPVHPGDCERDDTVLYFGQIRPNKGIEHFIALAHLSIAAGEPRRFIVIGSSPPRWHDYGRELRATAPATLHWLDDAPLATVAAVMASATAAYLPFPDGAGLRRGSLIAALANGLPIVAPLGPSTTESLRGVLFPAATPEGALDQLRRLRVTPSLGRQHASLGRILVQHRDWRVIADQHASLYRHMLNARAARSNAEKVTG